MKTELVADLSAMLEATAKRLGVTLQTAGNDWRAYAAERMLHLSTLVGEPGYVDAVAAEAANVALQAAGGVVSAADQVDAELAGTIAGGLAVGARALAGA